MYLLSKIIAKEWFKALVGGLIVLFLLITIGDIINGFMQSYSVKRIFLQYVLKLPEFMGKVLPICCLLASLFAINRLKGHAELMAILAGGFSAKRIYGLVLLLSISVAFLQFINLGYLQPLANKVKRNNFEKSRKNESRYLARSQAGESGLIWYKSQNYFASFSFFNQDKSEIRDISVYFLNDENKMYRLIRADKATYLGQSLWDLQNATEYSSLENKEFPQVNQSSFLKLELNENPDDFQQFKSDITTLYFASLYSFIMRLRGTDINSSEYEIILFDKIALSFSCIVFALFPLSSVFNPNRRSQSLGKSIVFTLLFTIAFWLLQSGALSLGSTNKIPPILATMAVPLLVLAYVAKTFHRHRKL